MDLGISQTTVGRAREQLADKFLPRDTQSDDWFDMVNEVVERFHTRGYWVGAKGVWKTSIPDDGFLTLPYWLESIISARIDSGIAWIRGTKYEFIHDGPGELDETTGCSGDIVDMGNVALEIPFPDTASTITVTANADDAGKGDSILLLGYDASGNRIEDGGETGERLILLSGDAVTTNTFAELKGIQKPITEKPIVITHTSSGATLATLQSFTENPYFRRYKIVANGAEFVTIYCKRKPVPVTQDTDYILPGNLSALKLGLYSLVYEEANDLDRARDYMREAESLLNAEAVEYRAGAQEPLEFSPWGPGVSGLGRLR